MFTIGQHNKNAQNKIAFIKPRMNKYLNSEPLLRQSQLFDAI